MSGDVRFGKETEVNNMPNLLHHARIKGAIDASIARARDDQKSGLKLRYKVQKTKKGSHSYEERSLSAVISSEKSRGFEEFMGIPTIDEIVAAKVQYIPQEEDVFSENEKRPTSLCVLVGINDSDEIVSVEFTSYAWGKTDNLAEIVYRVKQGDRKPAVWTDGEHNPLRFKDQISIAEAVGLPTA